VGDVVNSQRLFETEDTTPLYITYSPSEKVYRLNFYNW